MLLRMVKGHGLGVDPFQTLAMDGGGSNWFLDNYHYKKFICLFVCLLVWPLWFADRRVVSIIFKNNFLREYYPSWTLVVK